MFRVLRVVHQGVLRRQRRQARDDRQHNYESNGIGASVPVVSAGKVQQDIPLAKQEENSRDEVEIDVDWLVVDIQPTAERSVPSLRSADSHERYSCSIHIGIILESHRTREELGILPCPRSMRCR